MYSENRFLIKRYFIQIKFFDSQLSSMIVVIKLRTREQVRLENLGE